MNHDKTQVTPEEPSNDNHQEQTHAKQEHQVKENLKDIAAGVSGLAKTGAKEGSKLFKKGLIGGKKLFNKAAQQAKEAKLKSDLKKDQAGASVIVDADIEEKKET